MSSVNKVTIVGRLGNDPDVRQFNNGGMVTHISVATSEKWTDKQTGEKKEHTEWHRISLFNRLGEIAAQYLRKGSLVYIEGKLQTRKWQDQQGIERYSTEIQASELRMLGGTNDQNSGNGTYQGSPQQSYPQAHPQNQGYNQGYNPAYQPQQQAPQGGWTPPSQQFGTAPQGGQNFNTPAPQGYQGNPNQQPQQAPNYPNQGQHQGQQMANPSGIAPDFGNAPIAPNNKIVDDDMPF